MELRKGLASLPVSGEATAATVGFFDGVHKGHVAVLRRTVEVAAARGLVPVAVTFDRHPRAILTPGKEPPLLTTLERKSALISDIGLAVLVVLEFTEDFSRWSPEEFVRRILVERLNVGHAVVGSNFTFGHQAAGNVGVLTELGAAQGFPVQPVDLLEIEGRTVSASAIRQELSAGELPWATKALGRRFSVDGRVTAGAGRGASLGFPTANLEVPAGMLLPGRGVYAGKAYVNERGLVAAVNVGTNPTFGEEPLHVEAFLLDFEGDVKGLPMAVEFWARLREEIAFASPSDLARQIKDDVRRTRALVA